MFVTARSTDEWHGVSNKSQEVRHPSRDQIEKTIRRLDENKWTIVTIGKGTETYLAVGGSAGATSS